MEGRHTGWLTPEHHALAWVLSFETARRHYPDTMLVTDDAGAALLLDRLGLDFGSVDLSLNALAGHDPNWWAIGKLYAYALQDRPFIHIDNDVFLWERLPATLEQARVIAQHPEYTEYGASFYRPESIEHDLRQHGGWMPEAFDQYMPLGGVLKAENCGILGGTDVAFIRNYAEMAVRFIEHPCNQSIWARRPRRDQDFVVFEQLMLSACIAYYQKQPRSPFAGISISYLFASYEEALGCGDERGFTHLASDAKRHPELIVHMEQAVADLYPEQYRRFRAA